MGYSTNPDLIEARRDLLAPLERGETCQWKVKPATWDETRRTAGKIREGLYIASLYPHRFPALASAAARFSIHVVGKGILEARVRPVPNVETTAQSSSSPDLSFVPQTQVIDSPLGKDVPTVMLSTAAEVIASWQARGPSNDPMRFTQTRLPQDELLTLWQWANDNRHHPKLMLIVGDDNNTLIVSNYDMSMKDIAWNPRTREKEETLPRQAWQPPRKPSPLEEFDL